MTKPARRFSLGCFNIPKYQNPKKYVGPNSRNPNILIFWEQRLKNTVNVWIPDVWNPKFGGFGFYTHKMSEIWSKKNIIECLKSIVVRYQTLTAPLFNILFTHILRCQTNLHFAKRLLQLKSLKVILAKAAKTCLLKIYS